MNRERVQELRDVLAGIPEAQIDLDEIGGAGQVCNTIACIAGWAWIYPPFIEAGIRNGDGSRLGRCHEFFGTRAGLFSAKDDAERGTHKEVALRRLDKLLAE